MVDPSLSFLPVYADVEFIDCCNGLLLLRCKKISPNSELHYVVCNPATEKWTVLPVSNMMQDTETIQVLSQMYLCFEPSVSPHFRVFLLVRTGPSHDFLFISGLKIYSSETAGWTYSKSKWSYTTLRPRPESAFFRGTLHLITYIDGPVISVDMEGKTWGTIPTPTNFCFIGPSQGHLYGIEMNYGYCLQLAIWALEDYDGDEQWCLKLTVSTGELFGVHDLSYGTYAVIAIHPDRGLIFYTVGIEKNLMSYDIHGREVHHICTLGRDSVPPYLPYIPCFSEWSTDGR